MRATGIRFLLLFALTLPLACDDDGGSPAAPDTFEESITDAELAAGLHLDGLDEDQRAAVRAALTAARESLRALHARVRAGELTREAAHAEAQAVHDALLAALADVLTPDQLARLRPFGPGAPGGPGRPGGPGGPPHPELNLTEEQRAAIHALRSAFHDFLQALRAQVQDGTVTPEDARAQVRKRGLALRGAVCAVLSAEQQAQVRYCAPTPRG